MNKMHNKEPFFKEALLFIILFLNCNYTIASDYECGFEANYYYDFTKVKKNEGFYSFPESIKSKLSPEITYIISSEEKLVNSELNCLFTIETIVKNQLKIKEIINCNKENKLISYTSHNLDEAKNYGLKVSNESIRLNCALFEKNYLKKKEKLRYYDRKKVSVLSHSYEYYLKNLYNLSSQTDKQISKIVIKSENFNLNKTVDKEDINLKGELFEVETGKHDSGSWTEVWVKNKFILMDEISINNTKQKFINKNVYAQCLYNRKNVIQLEVLSLMKKYNYRLNTNVQCNSFMIKE